MRKPASGDFWWSSSNLGGQSLEDRHYFENRFSILICLAQDCGISIAMDGLELVSSGDATVLYQLWTHWGRDKMTAISQTTLSIAFSWMKMLEFWLNFHCSLFLRVQLTIFQHWFRLWLGAMHACQAVHDDIIKWEHFPRYWPFVRGIHQSPVNSPHKGHWRGALMFSLIWVWINGWVNNREAGDLRR